ncbi:MAG: MBL fold metallo-hydrolase [Sulfuricurvum sp.]|nr:MBL fold metallo-hydrolase [Sulfuricurvum sp.]
MIFEKFIDRDLGHVSYIVACSESKEAFVVDPRRDTKEYEEFIANHSLNLKYVFNTHTHADYIGGHIELASKFSVDNIFQKSAPIENFEIIKANDNDEFFIGSTLKVKILETPGHTPFDLCLLVNEFSTDKLLFTGDLLFVGDIGRPDLLGEDNLESLANSSYESALKLWELSDEIIVFTSHIEGSLCGKNLSRQYFSTIGIEKKTNYSFSLCQKSKFEYTENLIAQSIETPAFFKKMAGANISGPTLVEDILSNIGRFEFEELKQDDHIQIVDLREPRIFHKNHIRRSINICEHANVSLIAGNLLSYEKSIYLIGDLASNLQEFIIKLLRVGLDNIAGIINSDFGLIECKYLTSSNLIDKSEITNEFTNILLDKNCSNLGSIIQSNLTQSKELNIKSYSKICFSCNYGYKSSAITSMYNSDNLYYIMD